MATDPDRDPLLTTLLITRDICENPRHYSSANLSLRYNASDRQLKRYIAEARHLGADLKSVRRSGHGYVWECRNVEALTLLYRWIEISKNRTLIEDPPDPPLSA